MHCNIGEKMEKKMFGASKSTVPYILSNKSILGTLYKVFGVKLLLKTTDTFSLAGFFPVPMKFEFSTHPTYTLIPFTTISVLKK